MAAMTPANSAQVPVATLNRGGFTPNGQKNLMTLGAGVAMLVALIAAAVMWGRTPDFKVLYSNLSDKDGGAILAQLSQMNIPYKHADGGGAIMVPSDQVHEARLKLASQGLPKGSTVGFELLENQRFGATQFQEQVNFQRGLEGELAKSIQSLSSVQNARVHLALPKQSAFLREQQKPSASVILNLYPGRTLDRAQVAGIVHLVSSSVPDLPMKNVTALDQNGTLLSSTGDINSAGGLDPDKLNYLQQLEQSYIRRVIDLLEPIVGRNNVRAQVAADVDFAVIEQTAETFKPNVGEASVRSSAMNESSNGGGNNAQGVPGALSNQPPANPTAPLQGASAAPGQPAAPKNDAGAGPGKREQTTNYEVDKTIRVEKRPVGSVKRLSVAVVVNNSKSTDADGKVTMTPLSEADLAKITSLVREAVGFSQPRGDSLNVVNVPFNVDEKIAETEVPLWKQPENISLAKEIGKGLVLVIGLLVLVFGMIRPALRSIGARSAQIPSMDTAALSGPGAVYSPGVQAAQLSAANSAAQLADVRQLAKQEPGTVANVVRAWVNKDG
ncbi:MAG: flagellar M-ring protein FliF [Betaproteobacteria bacterium]|nr:flagellar M-ring protein FliF [Betaproteobacteria bacterium]